MIIINVILIQGFSLYLCWVLIDESNKMGGKYQKNIIFYFI